MDSYKAISGPSDLTKHQKFDKAWNDIDFLASIKTDKSYTRKYEGSHILFSGKELWIVEIEEGLSSTDLLFPSMYTRISN